MSSTNKTANIGLPQWVKSDALEMTDFNGAFAKIDEAFVKLPRQKLGYAEVKEEGLNLIEFDLSGVDTDQFAEFDIFADVSTQYVPMRINGENQVGDYFIHDENQTNMIRVFSGPGKLYSMKLIFRYLSPLNTTSSYVYKTTIPSINSIQFCPQNNDSNFAVGERISVWGVQR